MIWGVMLRRVRGRQVTGANFNRVKRETFCKLQKSAGSRMGRVIREEQPWVSGAGDRPCDDVGGVGGSCGSVLRWWGWYRGSCGLLL